MTTSGLLALDLLASALTTLAWLGTGAAAAFRRPKVALALFPVAVLVTLARVACVIALARAGWWFVQEKVIVAVPLLGLTVLVAAVLAGPRLVEAARGRGVMAARPIVVMPLLGAGFAAAAGLVHTLLLGYPATWSTGLLTVALFGVALLVSWRVVCPPVRGLRPGASAILAVALLGTGLAFAPVEATDLGGGVSGERHEHQGQAVTALRGPNAPAEGGRVRRFMLTARTSTIALSSGKQVAAWTFNGQVPGPAITATEGDLIEVRLRNADIESGVTLHWHGYDVPSGEDGVPGLTQDAVLPGEEFVYRFLANQVGTFWYHTHEVSDLGVRMGLYGTLVVHSRNRAEGLDLTLPVHTFSGTTVLGNHDQPIQQRAYPGMPTRLRLVNTDNTPHRFTLSGTPYRLVAIDGNDLNEPGEVSKVGLRLPAGGRYDLAFTMPATGVRLLVDDRTEGLKLVPAATTGALDPAGTTGSVETIENVRTTTGTTDAAGTTGTAGSTGSATAASPTAGPVENTASWPELDPLAYGEPAAPPFDANEQVKRRFTLVLDQGLAMVDGRPMYAHTVNGQAFPNVPTQIVTEGDLVRITVVNRGRETHPWHLHGHRVLVLSRDGRAPTGAPLLLDTFDVRPGEVWEVAFRATNPGLWMNHCHNLSHADMGMALHLSYEGVTTPFHGAHGG
ncbi:multicopper oxidase family protein [Microtetraspora sp. AC03309]|uniref:multicopper oxidase family protein n=1 Tax=Microtetraspora sp. AC03309 TaxID=2779376 RepID=UPI001E3728CE|nr:multicopper oxidase family protein [Microtetraspora sp. AC03309]MCC5578156.1 multicopper oxidase family protein [Microtetraspora sp. AC03309]